MEQTITVKLNCFNHADQPIDRVCLAEDAFGARLMCKVCDHANLHAEHREVPFDDFVKQVNSRSDEYGGQLESIIYQLDNKQASIISHIDEVKAELSAFCNGWARDIKTLFAACRESLKNTLERNNASMLTAESMEEDRAALSARVEASFEQYIRDHKKHMKWIEDKGNSLSRLEDSMTEHVQSMVYGVEEADSKVENCINRARRILKKQEPEPPARDSQMESEDRGDDHE